MERHIRKESDCFATYNFIVMYTISDNDLRNAFREEIQNQSNVEQLNESAYSFTADTIEIAREKIISLFGNIDKTIRKRFVDDDFIDIYCSGHRANYKTKKGMEDICRYHVLMEKD